MNRPDIPPAFTWEEASSGATRPASGKPRPLNAGVIADRAVSIYRRGFFILIVVAAVVEIPLGFVRTVVGQELTTSLEPFVELAGRGSTQEEFNAVMDAAFPALLTTIVTIGVVSWVGGLILTPAFIATISRLDSGERPSASDAYRTAFRSAIPIFAGSIVEGLVLGGAFFGPLLVGVLVAALIQDVALGAAVVLLALLFGLVASGYLGLRWAVWAQAVVVDELGPFEALGRSWHLVKGFMWRTFTILVMTAIVTAVAGLVLGLLGGAIAEGLPDAWRAIVPEVVGVLTVSWAAIVTTLIYIDLRARQEPPVATPTSANESDL